LVPVWVRPTAARIAITRTCAGFFDRRLEPPGARSTAPAHPNRQFSPTSPPRLLFIAQQPTIISGLCAVLRSAERRIASEFYRRTPNYRSLIRRHGGQRPALVASKGGRLITHRTAPIRRSGASRRIISSPAWVGPHALLTARGDGLFLDALQDYHEGTVGSNVATGVSEGVGRGGKPLVWRTSPNVGPAIAAVSTPTSRGPRAKLIFGAFFRLPRGEALVLGEFQCICGWRWTGTGAITN
jgi:hypothetical protein